MSEWLYEATEWMYWTWQSGVAIVALFTAIALMGVWDAQSPSIPRKGFYPIKTTRGDRLFIGIITSIFIFLVWLLLVGNTLLLAPTAICVAWAGAQGRWG
jgi:predicted small integral membrane protein